ncbi:MAG: hypothetical protein NWF13_01100 [Candidatus Bathyarchaeota archaeon]|nr:hypothetical protein [Candidatus Bathyarchaeota archaeon]
MKTGQKNVGNEGTLKRSPLRGCCRNPWRKKCENRNITVYIRYRGEQRPICKTCWKRIVTQGHQW